MFTGHVRSLSVKFCPLCLARIYEKTDAHLPVCVRCLRDLAGMDPSERMAIAVKVFSALESQRKSDTFEKFTRRLAEAIAIRSSPIFNPPNDN